MIVISSQFCSSQIHQESKQLKRMSSSPKLVSSSLSSAGMFSMSSPGTSSSRHPWIRHFLHLILFSIWKKRPFLLAIILITTLVIVAFQYHSVSSGPDSSSITKSSSWYSSLDASPSGFLSKSFSKSAVNVDLPLHESLSSSSKLTFPKRNLSSMNMQNTLHQPQRSNVNPSNGNLNDGNVQSVGNEDKSQDNLSGVSNQEAINHRSHGQDQRFHGEFRGDLNQGQNHGRIYPQQQSQQQIGNVKTAEESIGVTGVSYVPSMRLVHFDLKGAPPKVSYFKSVFPILKKAGANAILLEYEEMFPFWGSIQSIASPEAYTKDDISAIIQLAKVYEFEIIPLVQTFGHLEFALKLEEFRHLREVDQYPMAICPSKNDSFLLVTSIIDQVMSMHPSVRWLHIGADEVFHMGYCDLCRFKDRDAIFLQHVTRVARYVRDKYSVIPIVWDDMLRNIQPEKMKELGTLVEPMVWTYVKDVYRFIPYSTWNVFSEVFPNIWAASAFKGAFGETLTVPNAKMHLENNQAWLEVMYEQHRNFKGSFRGIVITGWQRYDHLGVLCELFPSGLPSLVLNLLTASNGKFDAAVVFKKFDSIMSCSSRNFYNTPSTPDLDSDPFLWNYASSCFFPGSAVFRLTQRTADVVKRVNDYEYDVTIHKAWMTAYNVRHNMSNPWRVDEGLQEYTGVYYTLTSLVREAEDALKEVFDKFTVSEWIEQNIYPYILKMETIMKNANDLKRARVWPRRPLPMLPDLKRFLTSDSKSWRRRRKWMNFYSIQNHLRLPFYVNYLVAFFSLLLISPSSSRDVRAESLSHYFSSRNLSCRSWKTLSNSPFTKEISSTRPGTLVSGLQTRWCLIWPNFAFRVSFQSLMINDLKGRGTLSFSLSLTWRWYSWCIPSAL